MRRLVAWPAPALLAAACAIQLVRPDRGNPAVDESRTLQAAVPMPAGAAAVFERACRDCHSSATRWPWYSRVAPVSWLVAGHVNHARSHLNVSEWAGYPREDGPRRVGEMCRWVKAGRMPLRSYLWMHPEARLSSEDVGALCAWAEAARRELEAAVTSPTAGAPAYPGAP